MEYVPEASYPHKGSTNLLKGGMSCSPASVPTVVVTSITIVESDCHFNHNSPVEEIQQLCSPVWSTCSQQVVHSTPHKPWSPIRYETKITVEDRTPCGTPKSMPIMDVDGSKLNTNQQPTPVGEITPMSPPRQPWSPIKYESKITVEDRWSAYSTQTA